MDTARVGRNHSVQCCSDNSSGPIVCPGTVQQSQTSDPIPGEKDKGTEVSLREVLLGSALEGTFSPQRKFPQARATFSENCSFLEANVLVLTFLLQM